MSEMIREDRPQLSDEAAAYVRELIVSGKLRPGEFIRLDRLAAALSMSVTPVRQALVTLRVEGFVQLEPRRGFQVSELREDDILDLFSVQAFVAGELAAHAAQRASEGQISRLKSVLTELEAAMRLGQTAAGESLAHEFHEIVFASAGRPKLVWLLQISGRYEPRRFYANISGWEPLSMREHKTIFTAIKRRDPDQARRAMAAHVQNLGRIVASNFAATTGPPLRELNSKRT